MTKLCASKTAHLFAVCDVMNRPWNNECIDTTIIEKKKKCRVQFEYNWAYLCPIQRNIVTYHVNDTETNTHLLTLFIAPFYAHKSSLANINIFMKNALFQFFCPIQFLGRLHARHIFYKTFWVFNKILRTIRSLISFIAIGLVL